MSRTGCRLKIQQKIFQQFLIFFVMIEGASLAEFAIGAHGRTSLCSQRMCSAEPRAAVIFRSHFGLLIWKKMRIQGQIGQCATAWSGFRVYEVMAAPCRET